MTEGYGFLRFLFTNYSESEYVREAWTPIEDLLKRFLENTTENFQPMSYQTIYCHVYKSTCKGYKKRLFEDVKKLVMNHCQNVKIQLDESMRKASGGHSNNRYLNNYILQFITDLRQFQRAVEAIGPLFHYLDVVYVKPQMRSTIRQELLVLYKTIVIESHLNQVFGVLQQLINGAEGPSKETIGLLLRLIDDVTPASAVKRRDLFKRYCNNEDVLNEISSNGEEMLTPASRTASKRSVDEVPGEEDQPSAKRTTNMIKSPRLDH